MRRIIAPVIIGFVLCLAGNVSAKAAVNYTAEEPDCPTAATPPEQGPDAQDSNPATPASSGPRSSATTIKSSKSSNRGGKWKALLPGTIK